MTTPLRIQLGIDIDPILPLGRTGAGEATLSWRRALVGTCTDALDNGADFISITHAERGHAAEALSLLTPLLGNRLELRISAADGVQSLPHGRIERLCLPLCALDSPQAGERLKARVNELFIAVSPTMSAIEQAYRSGADGVLIDSRPFAYAEGNERELAYEALSHAIDFACERELAVHVHGGLASRSAEAAAAIGGVSAAVVGASLLSRALHFGIADATSSLKKTIVDAQNTGLMDAALFDHGCECDHEHE